MHLIEITLDKEVLLSITECKLKDDLFVKRSNCKRHIQDFFFKKYNCFKCQMWEIRTGPKYILSLNCKLKTECDSLLDELTEKLQRYVMKINKNSVLINLSLVSRTEHEEAMKYYGICDIKRSAYNVDCGRISFKDPNKKLEYILTYPDHIIFEETPKFNVYEI